MRISSNSNFPDLIVLDEFHTDAIDNTILAYILKEELKKYNKKFKLIIASATINRLKTLDYFKEITRDMPIISVE
jgi:HrpA-like RNA helicase